MYLVYVNMNCIMIYGQFNNFEEKPLGIRLHTCYNRKAKWYRPLANNNKGDCYMEEMIKVKWYFRLFAKLDHEKTAVDNTTRIVAYVIDWVLSTMFTGLPTIIMYMAITKEEGMNQQLALFPSYFGYIAGVLSILFAMIYFIYIPLKVHKGQTYGKRFMDVKMVKKDGTDVDFKTLCKRQFLGLLLLEGCLIAAGNYVYQLVSMVIGIDVIFILSAISAAICIASIIISLRCDSRRMLHDYIGGTKLILEKKEAKR